MAISKRKSPSKKSALANSAVKKTTSKKSTSKKSASKKLSHTPSSAKKNKLGVKNSLVNNINVRKEKGKSRSKKNSTISKDSYLHMEEGWDKAKK